MKSSVALKQSVLRTAKIEKNRIVPVPIYIRELLVKGQPHHNIFTNTIRPLNEDYFKTLWSRFKRASKRIEQA